MNASTLSPRSPRAAGTLLTLACVVAMLILIAATIALTAAPAAAAGLSDPSLLTLHPGGLTVKEDGAVIENLEIQGTLRIEAKNVVVRNVWVYGSEFWSVYVASGSARFENVEIGHPSHLGSRGIGGDNITAVNVDIHHVEDGIKLGSNCTYSGIHVHDLASPSSSPHSDAVQVEGGAKNSTVKNSILSSTRGSVNGNAAVFVKSDLGLPSNITFSNNYLNGGNYTVYVRNGGYGMPSNISFIGNRFGPSRTYGLSSFDGPVTWENNTWADTGEVIDPSGKVIKAGSGTTTTTTRPPTTTTTTRPPSTTTTTRPPSSTTTTRPPSTTTTTLPTGTTTSTTAAADAPSDGTTTTTTPDEAAGVAPSETAPPGAAAQTPSTTDSTSAPRETTTQPPHDDTTTTTREAEIVAIGRFGGPTGGSPTANGLMAFGAMVALIAPIYAIAESATQRSR